MIHSKHEIQSADAVVAIAPVLPIYQQQPEYVGVLQWCSGPLVPFRMGELESLMFTLSPKPARSERAKQFHFRIVKHGKSLMDCTKKAGDKAVFDAFLTLCEDDKIRMCYDEPFAKDLADPELRQVIIDKITEQFNVLYQEPQ